MHAPEEDIAKYKGKYDARLRADPPGALRAAEGAGPDRPGLGAHARRPATGTSVEHKDWEARCMEVYAAMVDRMDQGIGRIVGRAEEAGPARQHADPLPAGQRRLRRGRWAATGNADAADTPDLHADGAGRAADRQIWPPMQTRDGRPVRHGPGRDARPGRTPTSPTAGAGPMSPTRRSASTSTGSTKAASPRR